MVQSFHCEVCGHLVFVDNSQCLSCGAPLGFRRDTLSVVALEAGGVDRLRSIADRREFRRCANQHLARCNWLLDADDPAELCESCRLTSVRPNDDEVEALSAFADAEGAKRRLLFQVFRLGLPIVDRAADPDGLTFELLSSRDRPVTTGHQSGVITLDLSESDDAHREFVRQQLGEPYRTVLGHLRHEIAHYFFPTLVERNDRIERFRELFGDEQQSYQAAMEQHYGDPRTEDWSETHVSQYATMHPWEDWAETFAHYLHVRDGLETASAFGVEIGEPSSSAGGDAWSSDATITIGPMIDRWLALTLALNAMSRSIGRGDLYPFVLAPYVVEKLDFVHRCVAS